MLDQSVFQLFTSREKPGLYSLLGQLKYPTDILIAAVAEIAQYDDGALLFVQLHEY